MPQLCSRRAAAPQPTCRNPSLFPAMPPAACLKPTMSHSARSRALLAVGIGVALMIGGGAAHAEPVAAQPQNIATPVDAFAGFIAEASQRFGIPASWVRAVMAIESVAEVRALSPEGAMGLMQIMPDAWAELRSRYDLGADPYDARDNILAGAAYLRELHDRYGAPGFLVAYNAGPARYEDHLATGRPLPAETQAYVATLAPLIGSESVDGAMIVEAVARSWSDAPLFAVHTKSRPTISSASADPRSGKSSADKTAADWTGLAPQSAGLFVSTSLGNRRP